MLCSLSVSLVYIKAWSTGVSGSCDWHWTWTWTIVSINKTFSSNSIIFLMDNWGLPNHGRNWWWWICFLSTLSFNINCNKKFAQKQDLWGLFLHTSGVILPYSMKSEKSPIWRNSWKDIKCLWLSSWNILHKKLMILVFYRLKKSYSSPEIWAFKDYNKNQLFQIFCDYSGNFHHNLEFFFPWSHFFVP